MRKAWVAALVAAGSLMAAPAFSTTLLATFTGSTNGFTDQSGLFDFQSEPGNRAIPFTAVFDYESDTGVGSSLHLEIGGAAADFTGMGLATRNDLIPVFGTDQNGYRQTFSGQGVSLNLQVGTVLPAPGLGTPGVASGPTFAISNLAGFAPDGSFRFQGTLVPRSVSVALTPIPEPRGWALMIGGFALVAACLRRHRTTLAERAGAPSRVGIARRKGA